ncbi:hypothetical protein KIPB_011672 [Kipferlia bialata]|uniref:Alkaline phosphatase n=1 Tax=Kipferlia bialata TaxID=797122 RepID=A0A9K3GNG7_9EUKA|nr:hypothetical protein KIPB_011672 [Kipferlia bialata]|eukprot:g11672.t1
MRLILCLCLCLLALVPLVACEQNNLVLFISDGMGMNHVEISRIIEMGDTGEKLSFEELDYNTTVGEWGICSK